MRHLPLLSILLILGLFCSSISSSNVRIGQDYALFFAVDNYTSNSDFENLKNPVKDANAIAKELKDKYAFETTVYENPSRNKIYEVLGEWHSRHFGTKDQLFVFFTGHGDFDEFVKKGYFIPSGSGQDKIDLTDLGNIITQIPCEHILLAIDACYSGTIDEKLVFQSLKLNIGRRPGENQTSERNRIINNMLSQKSRLLLTSGAKNRTPDGIDHSPFTEAILDELGKTSDISEGLISYHDLIARMERLSPKPHNSDFSGHKGGGFVFIADQLTEKIDPTITQLTDLETYQKASNAADPLPAYKQYLTDFPKGAYVAIVRKEIRILEIENRELDIWEKILARNTYGDFADFINAYPNSIYRPTAERKKKTLPTTFTKSSRYDRRPVGAIEFNAYRSISGKVTNSSGQALANANIKVEGTIYLITTDANGKFNFRIRRTAKSLSFSYSWYKTQSILANTASPMTISLDRRRAGDHLRGNQPKLGKNAGTHRNN